MAPIAATAGWRLGGALAAALVAGAAAAAGPSAGEVTRAKAALARLCAGQPGVCEEMARSVPESAPCHRDNSCLMDAIDRTRTICRRMPESTPCAQLTDMVRQLAAMNPDAGAGAGGLPAPEALPPAPALDSPGRRLRPPGSSAGQSAGQSTGQRAGESPGTAGGGGRWLKPPG
ncbi:hypothetical protein LNKW23_36290 [Paralimibaculum aggregatum]|uniref:Uncharacterized protein n=1 Tax=Paralimibaculum aggregatum TaxID=3036245 RepID=A0ABQ6LRN5_9RHOB|nr:hypothetical protein [Limibaculum sp. NKW23]GMG84413.1 hypothetical protein LNKW23_36290 [Limibaculum sp. NKW23]